MIYIVSFHFSDSETKLVKKFCYALFFSIFSW